MQIKKYFTILLAILVLVSNSGLAFNVHFCEDKIASITTVFSKEEVCVTPKKEKETCCAKLEKTDKKCCSDKEVNLKNKTEKVVVKTFIDADLFLFSNKYEVLISSSIFKGIKNEICAYFYNSNSPPLYLLYSQYIFYA